LINTLLDDQARQRPLRSIFILFFIIIHSF